MNVSPIILSAVVGSMLLTSPQTAFAQHRSHNPVIHNGHRPIYNTYRPRYQIDQRNHIVRDSHGHIIGRYHRGVVSQNSTYIVPHRGSHHGTYFVRGGRSYYTPRTASIGGQHVVSRPVAVQFGGFSHTDDLAGRMEELTNELLLDLHYNYSHNHRYRETYAGGYQLLQVAKFIHDAKHANDRAAIRARLNGMDALFHHLRDDVRGWSRHHHRQIGQLGILSKMDMIESTLHHLMNDVGVQQAPPPAGAVGQAPLPAGVAPAPLTTAPPPTVP